jgi:hypothetical protein
MSADIQGRVDRSLFARLISHRRHPLITVVIGLALAAFPFAAAYLDGLLDDLFSQGHWRPLLLAPVVITYILIVSPILTRMEAGVIQALRPLVLIDDEHFDRLVAGASRLSPIGEGISFGLGAALGLWSGRVAASEGSSFWIGLYLPLAGSLMFGLLAWTIYAVIASTRLTAELHRQPLRVDIFDVKPFEPIGRQSLVAALVFVGGILLGMVFSLERDSILLWQNWLVLGLLAMVPILAFFLNMRDTHRVLAAEKKRELDAVQRRILASCRALMAHTDARRDTSMAAAEINALVAYEKRIQAAKTWPYNTAMLRTLTFSVILPGAAAVVRAVFEIWFE